MEEKKLLRSTLLLLAVTTITVVFCYFYIDKPLAFWVHDHPHSKDSLWEWLSHLPEIYIGMMVIFYLYIVLKFSSKASFDSRILMFANGIAIAYFFKDFFKFIFGRYWPETWTNHNLSLIEHHQYGFHYLRKGIKYGAFPSGHTTILLTGTTLLWMMFPKAWPFYIIFILLSILGLIGMNYHFVSDVIAGGTLGLIIGLYVFAVATAVHENGDAKKLQQDDSHYTF